MGRVDLPVDKRDEGLKGTASFIGALACLTIASELVDDLRFGSNHFTIPRWLKPLAAVAFAGFAILEASKVRRRWANLHSRA